MRVRDRTDLTDLDEGAFLRLLLADPSGMWELHDGTPRSKQGGMTSAHNEPGRLLTFALQQQLGLDAFRVSFNAGHVKRSVRRYYIPDVIVIRIEQLRQRLALPDEVEVYTDPLPLVVEVWSPSTGSYDRDVKLAQYQARGDFEIWSIHPYERWLIAWRKQADGSYTETICTEGAIVPAFLPDVSIDLASILL